MKKGMLTFGLMGLGILFLFAAVAGALTAGCFQIRHNPKYASRLHGAALLNRWNDYALVETIPEGPGHYGGFACKIYRRTD